VSSESSHAPLARRRSIVESANDALSPTPTSSTSKPQSAVAPPLTRRKSISTFGGTARFKEDKVDNRAIGIDLAFAKAKGNKLTQAKVGGVVWCGVM
jgi:hypothetical protein